jgi:hypothetical protein
MSAALDATPTTDADSISYSRRLDLLAHHPLYDKDGELACPYDDLDRFIQHLETKCNGLFSFKAGMLEKRRQLGMNGNEKARQSVVFSICYDLYVRTPRPQCRYNQRWMDRHLVANASQSVRSKFSALGLCSHPSQSLKIMNEAIVKYLISIKSRLEDQKWSAAVKVDDFNYLHVAGGF